MILALILSILLNAMQWALAVFLTALVCKWWDNTELWSFFMSGFQAWPSSGSLQWVIYLAVICLVVEVIVDCRMFLIASRGADRALQEKLEKAGDKAMEEAMEAGLDKISSIEQKAKEEFVKIIEQHLEKGGHLWRVLVVGSSLLAMFILVWVGVGFWAAFLSAVARGITSSIFDFFTKGLQVGILVSKFKKSVD